MAKNALIVQARLGSTRLPQKMLLELNEETVLEILLKKLQNIPLVDEFVLATTDLPEDDPLVSIVHKTKFSLFRGSSTNVLERFYDTALQCYDDAREIGELALSIDQDLLAQVEVQFDKLGKKLGIF